VHYRHHVAVREHNIRSPEGCYWRVRMTKVCVLVVTRRFTRIVPTVWPSLRDHNEVASCSSYVTDPCTNIAATLVPIRSENDKPAPSHSVRPAEREHLFRRRRAVGW